MQLKLCGLVGQAAQQLAAILLRLCVASLDLIDELTYEQMDATRLSDVMFVDAAGRHHDSRRAGGCLRLAGRVEFQ